MPGGTGCVVAAAAWRTGCYACCCSASFRSPTCLCFCNCAQAPGLRREFRCYARCQRPPGLEALVAGTELLHGPNSLTLRSVAGMLSVDGRCKTFNATANGRAVASALPRGFPAGRPPCTEGRVLGARASESDFRARWARQGWRAFGGVSIHVLSSVPLAMGDGFGRTSAKRNETKRNGILMHVHLSPGSSLVCAASSLACAASNLVCAADAAPMLAAGPRAEG